MGQSLSPVTQPRAAIYSESSRTLIVAGEGDDRLAFFAAERVNFVLSYGAFASDLFASEGVIVDQFIPTASSRAVRSTDSMLPMVLGFVSFSRIQSRTWRHLMSVRALAPNCAAVGQMRARLQL